MRMMAYSYMAKTERKVMMNVELNGLDGVGIGSCSGPLLMISQLPDSRTMGKISRSLFMVLFLFSLPSIGSSIRTGPSHISDESNVAYLVKEGILKKGYEGLIVESSGIGEGNLVDKDLDTLNKNGIDFAFMSNSDVSNGENANIPNETLDFVFVQDSKNVKAIDPLLKLGGAVICQVENNKRYQLQPPANYVVVVYLVPYEHTTVVLRKIGHSSSIDGLEKKMPTRRSLYSISPEAKKEALLGLEDVVLEPPRKTSKLRNKLTRKMKFLPDLLKDSLQNYPRRIFFSDGDNGVFKWFKKNYPARGQAFEMFDMEVVAANNGKIAGVAQLSDWLRDHVEEHDYVVMKAEATLVEEMIKENTVSLIDELFLECKNQWGEEEEHGEDDVSGKRSYWQCLELYGRLTDEGIAVHQWWS
ncbi:hypothetical protein LIER_23947 [Lithospermum erythrorhizon]|uniref:DUF7870 domain-containing protein n=1 Tax=Lithospermum erythrorhizon TaxID=34254 RepID=A0AAV3R0J1_LITER